METFISKKISKRGVSQNKNVQNDDNSMSFHIPSNEQIKKSKHLSKREQDDGLASEDEQGHLSPSEPQERSLTTRGATEEDSLSNATIVTAGADQDREENNLLLPLLSGLLGVGVLAAALGGGGGGGSDAEPVPSTLAVVKSITEDRGASATDFITSDNTLVFVAEPTAALKEGERVQISIDGGVTWHDATLVDGKWQYDNSAQTVVDGTYKVSARVANDQGGGAAGTVQDVVVTTAKPTAYVTWDKVSDESGASPHDFWTSDTTRIFSGSILGTWNPDYKLVLLIDYSAFGTQYQPVEAIATVNAADGTWQYDHSAFTAPLGEGKYYTLDAFIIDEAGNYTELYNHGKRNAADTLNGTQYGEWLFGEGGADTITAGAGNDTVVVEDTQYVKIDGGAGSDTLMFNTYDLATSTYDFDLSHLAAVTGIEKMDISYAKTANDPNAYLTVSYNDIVRISDTDVLTVTAFETSSAIAQPHLNISNGGGVLTATTVIQNGVTYAGYDLGGSSAVDLLVHSGIQVHFV